MTEEFEEFFESNRDLLLWDTSDAMFIAWEEGRAALKREQAEKAATAIHEAMEPKKGN